MAPDPASRERLAALAPHPPAASPGPSPGAAEIPAGPLDALDPDFWGTEPRTVRRGRRSADEAPVAAPDWWSALADRARGLRLEVGIGIVAVVVVALIAGVVWYRMAYAGGAPPIASSPSPPSSDRGAAATTDEESSAVPAGVTPVEVTTPAGARAARGASLVVHVAGAVAKPGVLLMPTGARVIDAVEGAGGATPEADLDRINLAAKLVDGQRIVVVRVGAPAVADPSGGGAAADPGAPVDLNTATSAQLEALPGIGPTLAAAILAERDRRGGFRSVNELRDVRGIGEARFADLRDRVTV